MLTFLSMVFDFFDDLLSFEIINGVSLYIVFFYNMILLSFWVVFTRR